MFVKTCVVFSFLLEVLVPYEAVFELLSVVFLVILECLVDFADAEAPVPDVW